MITQGPTNVTYFPGQPDIQLTCTVSSGVPIWIINGTAVTLNQFDNPSDTVPPGHSRNGTNIIISAPPVNNTMYVCELPVTADDFIQHLYMLLVSDLLLMNLLCMEINLY